MKKIDHYCLVFPFWFSFGSQHTCITTLNPMMKHMFKQMQMMICNIINCFKGVVEIGAGFDVVNQKGSIYRDPKA